MPLSKIFSLSLKLSKIFSLSLKVGGGGLTQRLSEDPGSFYPVALVSSAHGTRLTQDGCSGPAHHTGNGRTHSFLLGGSMFLLTLARPNQPEHRPRIYPDTGGHSPTRQHKSCLDPLSPQPPLDKALHTRGPSSTHQPQNALGPSPAFQEACFSL